MSFDIVTGGQGFIGSHLCDALRKRGRCVEVIDIKTLRLQSPGIEKPINPEKFHGCDTVYHLAALSNIIPSITNPRDYYETNVTGTFNVLEAARLAGVKKFVYAASASCYGKDYTEDRNEDDLCTPAYPYALTKYLGEQLVMHYGKVYGMNVVSLRIFNCYGPKSLTKSAYGAMFNTFLAQKANNRPMTIIGDGTQARDFIYVDDVVEGFIIAAEKGAGIYNCGTGNATSINQVCKAIGGTVVHVPERAGEPHCIYADNRKLRSLGWEPKITVEEGISLMMKHLDYWKSAKVWEPDTIAQEIKEWQSCLKK